MTILFRAAAVLSFGLFLLAGCVPVTSTHAVVDPRQVTQVIAWEPPGDARPTPRYAVVNGQAAADLVRCMTYTRQDNPFSRIDCVVGAKGHGETLLIKQHNGPALKVELADGYFFWNGPQGQLNPPFQALYDRLPWQPGETPAATTQP